MTDYGVIISGGSLDEAFALAFLAEKGIRGDMAAACPQLMAADRGLCFCREQQLVPGYIVGDFDSAGKEILRRYEGRKDVQIRAFRPEKDWTDTEIAVSLGISLGWKKMSILGGTGTRIDHVLGNLQVLEMAARQGIMAELVDGHNRIRLHTAAFTLKKEEQWGNYISLIPWGGNVSGLTLEGMKYTVEDYTMITGASRGISNEITAPSARISFQSGMLLSIESRD